MNQYNLTRMKFRKTLSSVLISIILFAVVLFAVVFLRVANYSSKGVETIIYSLIPSSDNGLEIKVGSIKSTVMKSINISDISINVKGDEIAKISNVDVSLSLFNLVSLAFGQKISALDVKVSDVNLTIEQKSLNSLKEVINSFSTTAQKEDNSSNILDRIEIAITLRNLNAKANLKGLKATIDNVNAHSLLKEGLKIDYADLNIPSISIEGIGDSLVVVEDSRLSISEDLSASGSIKSIKYGDSVKASDISAIGLLSEKKLSAALFMQNISASYNEVSFFLDSSTIRGEYDIESSEVSFSLQTNEIELMHANNLVITENLELQGLYSDFSDISALINLGHLNYSSDALKINLKNLESDLGLTLSNENVDLSSLGQILISSTEIAFNDQEVLKNINLQSLILDYSYSPLGLEGRLRGFLDGLSNLEYLGSFSSFFDISAQTRDFKSLQRASIVLEKLNVAALHDSANINLNLSSDGNLKASVSIKDDVESSIDLNLKEQNLDLRLYLTDFRPHKYDVIYNNVLSDFTFLDEKTFFDGSVVIASKLTKDFSSYLSEFKNFSIGKYNADNIFDIIENLRFSLNTAASDINLSSGRLSSAITLDTSMDSTNLAINNFALSAYNLRLSYSGNIDLNQMLPDGRLALQKANDGSDLASIYFSYIKGRRLYEFILETPLEESTKLSGSLDLEELERITAKVKLDSKFVSNEGLSFDVIVKPKPLNVKIEGPNLNIEVTKQASLFNIVGSLNKLLINASETLPIVVDTNISSIINTSEKEFKFALEDLRVKVSDLLSVGLGLEVSQNSIFIDNLSAERGESKAKFDGFLDFKFNSIPDIIKGDTNSLKAVVDISSSDFGYIKGSAIEDQYYLDLYIDDLGYNNIDAVLSFLGKKNQGFYLTSNVSWGENADKGFTINALYKDKKLSFYDTTGSIGNLDLNNIDFNVDFSKMIVQASIDFLNERLFKTGEVKTQKGTINLSAKVEGLTNSLLQIFAGLDYDLVFDFGLSNVLLADGFALSDTSANIVLHNGVLNIKGNLINGLYDIRKKYIDLSIDPKFLFGFNAKGYIGKNIDLMLNDLYFPLPILNQLLNLPIASFEEGILEGDVLVLGPLDNPSFYGMAYCQSLGMSLFYLPEQSLYLKNVSMSLSEHTIATTRSSLSGYSNIDGRYFYGDVALEIIMQGLSIQSLTIDSNISDNSPVDLWLPLKFGNTEFEIRGDVTGYIQYRLENGRSRLTSDCRAFNTLLDFKLPQMPIWFGKGSGSLDLDVKIETGKNIDFYYPEKDNSFINFTLSEGENVRILVQDGKFSTDGGFSLKTGQVYYFHNDFIIKEGSVDLSRKKYNTSNSGIPFVLNLTAELTEYDANGNKVIIDLILKDSTLDNINPRFSSKPIMNQNEILSMLGQSVLSSGSLDSQVSVASIASLAATAADALSRVGVIESNNNYSLSSTIRNSLGLDIFSARSNIISNVIVDALPGDLTGRSDISMLARYLDGTSLYAGKYLGSDLFLRLTLMLKADSNAASLNNVGHFLAKDLILDTEISVDWDNPMGTFTIFAQPQELSVFDILDTIGFSVTKQIQF